MSDWQTIADEARFFRKRGDFQRAITLWETYLLRHPEDELAFSELAHACYDAGEYRKAIVYADRILKLLPNDLGLNKLKGDAAMKLSAGEGGNEFLHLARKYYHQALNNLHKRLNGEQLPDYHFALLMDRRKMPPSAASFCAEIYLALGEYDRAIEYYGSALQRRQQPRLYRGLGEALLRSGSPREAIGAFEYALTLNADDLPTYEALLEACRQAGDSRRLVHYARRALRCDGGNLRFLEAMRTGYERLGERRKAAECARRAKLLERKSGEESISTVTESFGEARQAA